MYGDLQQIYAWLFLFWQVGDSNPSQLLVPRAYNQLQAGATWKDAEKLLGTARRHVSYYTIDIGRGFSFSWNGVAMWETRFCRVSARFCDGKVLDKFLSLSSAGIDGRRQLLDLRSRLGPILTPVFRCALFVESTIRAVR
jgi:hypothetical protein